MEVKIKLNPEYLIKRLDNGSFYWSYGQWGTEPSAVRYEDYGIAVKIRNAIENDRGIVCEIVPCGSSF